MLTRERILEALKDVKDPELNRSLVDLNMIRDIHIKDDGTVMLTVVLTIAGCPLRNTIEKDIVNRLKGIGAKKISLTFGSMTDEERAELAKRLRQEAGQGKAKEGGALLSPLLAPDSKTRFIAITSGKGGVGKSTITVNLAVALARKGKKVGVIDADIYGFSIPDMMGIEQRPTVIDEMILPVEKHGVKVMSMGFFVTDNSPVIWRGPMLGRMLRNFFSEVYWGELDYMILDLPPGTGDVALDVHTLIPQCKEIIVTTPHATAAFVAARAGTMAIKTKHEILGVVENMAYYQLPDGSKDYIFGRGGGEKLAKVLKTELLAQIPLGQADPQATVDDPSPSIYAEDTPIGQIYAKLAERILEKTE